MDIKSIIKNLHPLEIKVLKNFKIGEYLDNKKLELKLSYKEGHANQVFSWLKMKGLIKETDRKKHIFFELTNIGTDFAERGTPEQRILQLLKEKGELKLPEIAEALNLENKDVGSAFGILSKEGAVKMNEEKRASFVQEPQSKRFKITVELLKKGLKTEGHIIAEEDLDDEEREIINSISKKRGAADSPYKIVERDSVVYGFTDDVPSLQKELEAVNFILSPLISL